VGTIDLAGLFVPGGLRETVFERNLVVPQKRFGADQIVILLRRIEVLISQCKSAPMACQDAGVCGCPRAGAGDRKTGSTRH
jgi:hypothetical protein